MPAPPLDGNNLTVQLWPCCRKHRRARTWPALKSSLLEHSRAAGGLGQHFCSNGPGLRIAWKLQHEVPQCPPENSAHWSRADPAPKKGSVKESNQLPGKARNEQQPRQFLTCCCFKHYARDQQLPSTGLLSTTRVQLASAGPGRCP